MSRWRPPPDEPSRVGTGIHQRNIIHFLEGIFTSPGIWSILRADGEARMGKLHQFGKTIIRIYANDHLPPHFHVLTPEAEALVEIATLRIVVGTLSSRVEREALAWSAANKALIAAEWNRINPRFPIA